MSSSSVAAKSITVFFELSYGVSSVFRRNDSQDSITNAFGTFASEPSLKITLPVFTGAFERREIEVELAFASDPVLFQALCSSRAFSEVYSRAWQHIKDESGEEFRYLYSGRFTGSIRNPGGKENIVKLRLITPKAELKRSAGIVSADTCAWNFGDTKTCTVALGPLAESGNITVVNRNIVTITGLGSHRDKYWHKGTVKADGVIIPIKEWVSGTSFKLSKLIPLAWEEAVISAGFKAVSVVPGCDQLKTTCGLWNNLSNMTPIGIATPRYNPFFENAG